MNQHGQSRRPGLPVRSLLDLLLRVVRIALEVVSRLEQEALAARSVLDVENSVPVLSPVDELRREVQVTTDGVSEGQRAGDEMVLDVPEQTLQH